MPRKRCHVCNGRGVVGSADGTCPECHGKGYIEEGWRSDSDGSWPGLIYVIAGVVLFASVITGLFVGFEWERWAPLKWLVFVPIAVILLALVLDIIRWVRKRREHS